MHPFAYKGTGLQICLPAPRDTQKAATNLRIIVGVIAGDAELEQSKDWCLRVKLIRPDYLKIHQLIQVDWYGLLVFGSAYSCLLLVSLLGGSVEIDCNVIKSDFLFNLEPFLSKVGPRRHVSEPFANLDSLKSLQMLSSFFSATTPPNLQRWSARTVIILSTWRCWTKTSSSHPLPSP